MGIQVTKREKPGRLLLGSASGNRYKDKPAARKKSRRKDRTVGTGRKESRPLGQVLAGLADSGWDPLSRALAWIMVLVSAVLFFVSVSLGLLSGFNWVTSNDYFTLDRVVIEGNERLLDQEIMMAAGIRTGMNSFALNMREVETALAGNPWVESVSVKRVLPDAFHIRITEREPQFWVRRGTELAYADAEGVPFAPVEPQGFIPMPYLEMEDGGGPVELLPRLIALDGAGRLPLPLGEASWVRLPAGGGLELGYGEQGPVFLFDTDEWELSVRRLALVWEDLVRRGEADGVAAIMAMGNNVWVSQRPGRHE